MLRGGREESSGLSEGKRKRKRDVSVDADVSETVDNKIFHILSFQFGLIDVPAVISLFTDLLTDFITNKYYI